MAFGEGHADFRIALEAPNARSVTGTRVDDDDGGCIRPNLSLQVVGATARDTEQGIVGRALEGSRIQ